MIPAGHWKIVGTDFSSLSPLSPLAPQLIQFCFSMGSTEWCQLLSAMFISVSPPPSTVLSCTTFCSTKMPLVLPEWYHCSAETQQGPAVCRAWHPFNDSGTGSEANDFGIIQNHLHKKKIIVITVSTVFIYVRACHPHGYLFRTPKSLLDGPCGGPNTHRKALGEPCCLGVWVGAAVWESVLCFLAMGQIWLLLPALPVRAKHPRGITFCCEPCFDCLLWFHTVWSTVYGNLHLTASSRLVRFPAKKLLQTSANAFCLRIK